MANLLVTGGAGFIGSSFVRHWRHRHPGDVIVVLDALTYAGVRANLDGVEDIDFVHDDIRNQAHVEAILSDRRIDTIVHMAAETHVDRSIAGPDAFIDTNVVGTHSLLKAARAIWLDAGTGAPHRFHHVSTDEVYGSLEPHALAFTEDSPYRPNSPYAASKAASDHLVRAYARTYGLQVTISNASNNFGARQFPEKLIPLVITHALTGRAIPIYGDGGQRRDWISVEDHIAGIEQVLSRGRVGETYNLGGGTERSNLMVVDALCAALDRAFAADPALAAAFPHAPAARGEPSAALGSFVSDRPGHDRRYAIDSSKAREQIGYRPSGGFEAQLISTVEWYLANQEWWSARHAILS